MKFLVEEEKDTHYVRIHDNVLWHQDLSGADDIVISQMAQQLKTTLHAQLIIIHTTPMPSNEYIAVPKNIKSPLQEPNNGSSLGGTFCPMCENMYCRFKQKLKISIRFSTTLY